jgi:hypothetical protein
MKHTSCKRPACYALILGILVGLGSRAYGDDTITGTVLLDRGASFTGTEEGKTDADKQKLDQRIDGYHQDDNVHATYSIATKTDSHGVVTQDLSKTSTVRFTDINEDGSLFVTQPIPITLAKFDEKTGKVTSIQFKGTDWYDPNAKRANEVSNQKIDGSFNVDPNHPEKGTGSLTASYTTKDGTATQNISFTTTPVKREQVRHGKDGAPIASDTRIKQTKSLDYNATTGILSIHDDTVIKTPLANDPILGAALSFPDFQFKGLTLDGSLAVFWPTDSTPYVMAQGGSVYQESSIPFLLYDTAENQFLAPLIDTTLAGVAPGSPFFDPNLANVSSPFLNSLDDILNPSSADFDPNANLYISISPDVSFSAMTNDFTSSALTGANDLEFVGDPVPEPSTLVVFGLGFGGLLGYLWRQRKR